MRHARPDYAHIQDASGKIPDDEPVFLIRGQDIAAPEAVDMWARIARAYGAASNIVEAAHAQAERMRQYQRHAAGRLKTPDMP